VHDVQGGTAVVTYLTEGVIRARYGNAGDDMINNWRVCEGYCEGN
jgi:hypothetical protein